MQTNNISKISTKIILIKMYKTMKIKMHIDLIQNLRSSKQQQQQQKTVMCITNVKMNKKCLLLKKKEMRFECLIFVLNTEKCKIVHQENYFYFLYEIYKVF